MIEGLQVDVKSAELKKIIAERVEYHQAKQKAYEAKAAELRKTMTNIEEDMEVGKTGSGDPGEACAKSARDHKDKATHFTFLLEHVIQDDVYRLSQTDLQLLGIAHRGW